MQIISKFALIGLSLLSLVKIAAAEVIELDMKNVDKCQAQIAEASSNVVILLDYDKSCSISHDYMPIYEKVSANHLKIAFFKAQVFTASSEVRLKCLQRFTAWSPVPRTQLYWKTIDQTTQQVVLSNPLMVYTGLMNEKDLEASLSRFFDLSVEADMFTKFNK